LDLSTTALAIGKTIA